VAEIDDDASYPTAVWPREVEHDLARYSCRRTDRGEEPVVLVEEDLVDRVRDQPRGRDKPEHRGRRAPRWPTVVLRVGNPRRRGERYERHDARSDRAPAACFVDGSRLMHPHSEAIMAQRSRARAASGTHGHPRGRNDGSEGRPAPRVIPSGGAKRRSRGIARHLVEGPLYRDGGDSSTPRLWRSARNDPAIPRLRRLRSE